jgi:hypothetical protein
MEHDDALVQLPESFGLFIGLVQHLTFLLQEERQYFFLVIFIGLCGCIFAGSHKEGKPKPQKPPWSYVFFSPSAG